jgi:hypothetical protein
LVAVSINLLQLKLSSVKCLNSLPPKGTRRDRRKSQKKKKTSSEFLAPQSRFKLALARIQATNVSDCSIWENHIA